MVVFFISVQQHAFQMGIVQIVWCHLCFHCHTAVHTHFSAFCIHFWNVVACVNLCTALICEDIHFQAVIAGCQCAEFTVFADVAVAEEMVVQTSYARLFFSYRQNRWTQYFFFCKVKVCAGCFCGASVACANIFA